MWSWPNASFPAISRYFINTYNENITTYGRWRYSFDLLHFSLDGGEFLTQNIAGPFLVEQILNRPSTSEQDEDEPRFDAHFTPRVPLKLSVASYTSWGLHENTLVNITTPPLDWSLNSLHHHHNTKEGNWVFEQARHRKEIPDNIHTCYASSSPHLLHSPSPAEFLLLLQAPQNRAPAAPVCPATAGSLSPPCTAGTSHMLATYPVAYTLLDYRFFQRARTRTRTRTVCSMSLILQKSSSTAVSTSKVLPSLTQLRYLYQCITNLKTTVDTFFGAISSTICILASTPLKSPLRLTCKSSGLETLTYIHHTFTAFQVAVELTPLILINFVLSSV